jgi:hypothetical protein
MKIYANSKCHQIFKNKKAIISLYPLTTIFKMNKIIKEIKKYKIFKPYRRVVVQIKHKCLLL